MYSKLYKNNDYYDFLIDINTEVIACTKRPITGRKPIIIDL
ncbi:hypothetical protein N9C95_00935 [Gammaproteobacteria bacterium]|nr:hypothetical protein [Gammaproteobacteria bacterium]